MHYFECDTLPGLILKYCQDLVLICYSIQGIVRTTYRDLPAVEDYSYSSDSGEGVDVYILDT